MQAVILAAGMGKRLGHLTENNTKCMVKVNGTRLIDRLLGQLSIFSLDRIIIVVGYKGDILKQYLGDNHDGVRIEYIENPVYDRTNNIYSLFLTKDELQKDDTLLIESDLIFEDSVFRRLKGCGYENVAIVDKYDSWMDGTMVCIDEDSNIVNFISQKAFSYKDIGSYYKTVNIYRLSKEFLSQKYIPFLEAYTQALGTNEYYEHVLRVIALLENSELKALPLCGEKWYEIDDIQDLDIAEAIFADPDKKYPKFQNRYGGFWRFPSMLDFCYLVNPYFPTNRLKEEIKSNFDRLIYEYPSGMAVNCLLAGKYTGLPKEYLCVGNGASELMKSLLLILEGKIGMVYPTFEEYPNRIKDKSRIVGFTPQNENFSYGWKDLAGAFEEKGLSSMIVINPDNPSGNFIPAKDMLELAGWTLKRGIRLIIDESFIDFTDGGGKNSLMDRDTLEKFPNLAIIKSISKSFGVPGLRLGFLATSDTELSGHVRSDLPIWNINSFAEFYLQIFSKYACDYRNACAKFRMERTRFAAELDRIGFIRRIDSQANYFLCEIKGNFTAGELTDRLLNEYDILIKDCSSKHGMDPGKYIRLAIRNTEDNDMLVKALEKLDNEKMNRGNEI